MPFIEIDESFGARELEMAGKLLVAAANSNIPTHGLSVEFNPSSGNVFLLTAGDEIYMFNGDSFEQFYILDGTSVEGFYDELHDEYMNGNIDDVHDLKALLNIASANHDYDTEAMIRIELDYNNEVGFLQRGLTHDPDELIALRAVAEKFGHENVVAMANEALEDVTPRYLNAVEVSAGKNKTSNEREV